jgi:hypothetical protein
MRACQFPTEGLPWSSEGQEPKMFYFAILIAILGTVIYHLAQKATPRSLDPLLSVSVA